MKESLLLYTVVLIDVKKLGIKRMYIYIIIHTYTLVIYLNRDFNRFVYLCFVKFHAMDLLSDTPLRGRNEGRKEGRKGANQ